ncbi:possible three-deoxy-D-manno-octulosonic-acid transferase [Psychrobacter arcticus 273-4]|uniref:3-deoxy-D-manno-octulosonic acid transferase n=1 Tax=Psychrobacter arcticus (strain DSM 17307 / VKM B-2377 / 273-4) TaxID=259536 RepID=Q4FRG1_PSYA2|nr:3-deoxy-D-manno-octulosonic acid transferase [Psychrobacter arcticus]AAZ19397.1 possible three-deoxy-D-manno-octulosonic-acid transferase [Psychrobacter arcticus 273-4]
MPSSDTSKNLSDNALPMQSRAVHKPPVYYQLSIGLLKPLYRLQVWRRSHARDNYQQEVEQRFGKRYPAPPIATQTPMPAANLNSSSINISKQNKTIWCHAVSLGETNTVAPLLDVLLACGYRIWLTNTTQTGFARGASRFAEDIAQGRLSHSYVPVDSPAVIERFLNHVQPIAALFVETELWANILTKLSEHHIPSILVNGRLSTSSFKSYQKIGAVSASMVKNLSLIIAQDNDSAKRFRQLGAHSAQIRVAGSLKWVINTPKLNDNVADIDGDITHKLTDIEARTSDIAADLGIINRPIWVAASTHSGEENTVLSWQQQLLSNSALAEVLLIIVPRHPERFDEVAALIQKSGLIMARRSAAEAIDINTQVYLADSMGELMNWYTLADVALVGGSLVEVGGHNPVEPASVATPVLMGIYTQSCQSVVDKLASVGALYQPNNDFYRPLDSVDQAIKHPKSVDNKMLLCQQLKYWLSHLTLAKQAGQAGAQMTEQQQAVLSRQLSMIEKVIEQHAMQNVSQDLN